MKLRDTRPVREALSDLDFPADKRRIVAHARRHGADEATDKALSALPLGDYAGIAEVLRSVEVDPAPDRTGSERFRQRSRAGHSGVAEHLRPGGKTPIEEELE